MSCEYCNGKETIYQETNFSKISIGTFGKRKAIITEDNRCPICVNSSMKHVPSRATFFINYCPNCGENLEK